MKKFWLTLGLTLMLVGWGVGGYYGLGTSPSFAQDYNYCDPNVQSCYNNYYSAPYADPLSQFLYYVAPPVQERREYREEREEGYERGNEGRGQGRGRR
jgi:hypothetical protein